MVEDGFKRLLQQFASCLVLFDVVSLFSWLVCDIVDSISMCRWITSFKWFCLLCSLIVRTLSFRDWSSELCLRYVYYFWHLQLNILCMMRLKCLMLWYAFDMCTVWIYKIYLENNRLEFQSIHNITVESISTKSPSGFHWLLLL